LTTPTCRAPTLSPHVHPWTGRAGLRQVAALICTLLVSAAGAIGNCTIGNGTLNFGSYSPQTGALATAAVNINCDLRICDFGLARGIDTELRVDLTDYVVTRWYRRPSCCS